VTLRSDYWGQGAHSALPIVGDFFQRAQRARIVDTKAKFDTEPSPGWFASVRERVTDLFGAWFTAEPNKAPAPVRAQRAPRAADADDDASAASAASAPDAASDGIVEEWIPASDVAASAAALSGASQPQLQSPPPSQSAPPPATNGSGTTGSAPPVVTSPAAPAVPSAPASPDAASSVQ
jgi:penicillin-binding protein 1A